MKFDSNWSFEEIVYNVQALKEEYEDTLASFLWHELRERNDFISDMKERVYSLNFKEWKKDKIWNYLNGYEYFSVLQGILDREQKK